MKKFTIVLWLIFLGFIALVVYQNQNYFFSVQSLDINLLIEQYTTRPVPNILYFAGCFIAGFLIAYFFSLTYRFKAGSTIKALTSELEELKGTATAENQVSFTDTEPPVTEPADTRETLPSKESEPSSKETEKTSS